MSPKNAIYTQKSPKIDRRLWEAVFRIQFLLYCIKSYPRFIKRIFEEKVFQSDSGVYQKNANLGFKINIFPENSCFFPLIAHKLQMCDPTLPQNGQNKHDCHSPFFSLIIQGFLKFDFRDLKFFKLKKLNFWVPQIFYLAPYALKIM